MIENFDEALAAALIEPGFTEIRRVEDHVEVRRPESFHPYIQFLWFRCFENLPAVPVSGDGGWISLKEAAHYKKQ